jgi:transcriptional regulator with XRE-family HTH domain
MARKILPMTEQLRRAIDASGLSRYRICKEINLAESAMSHFMAGHHGLSFEVLDKIGTLLRLEIVASKPKTKAKR